ncbi:MAG: phosphonate ABC transporter ATP-binding protein [Hyphomicrobiaceae bacterium]
MSQAAAIIEARDVSKVFASGGPTILDRVSVTINSGEAVAIIGSNGAGKSTFLRCAVGLIPLSSGEIDAFGERFRKQPSIAQRRRLRRNIGFVFQFHGLVGRLSALSNVVHGALGQGTGWRAWHQALAPDHLRTAALDALDRVGLAERAHDRAESLSGGQSQRVAIARAIMHKPRLLIADEPVASLDPASGRDVMALFRALTGSETTLVYTTHNIDHALDYSDRVIAMRHGRIEIDASTSSLNTADVERIYRD